MIFVSVEKLMLHFEVTHVHSHKTYFHVIHSCFSVQTSKYDNIYHIQTMCDSNCLACYTNLTNCKNQNKVSV